MKKKKKYLGSRKERALLADVLPYELPITFTNRYFKEFLISNYIEINDTKIKWKKDSETLHNIIKLLFGLVDSDLLKSDINGEIEINRKPRPKNKNNPLRTIPFSYKISHNSNEFRELTLIHPLNQLTLIEFYEKHKYLILYYCGISPYSIRRPFKVAKYSFHKDKTHFKYLAYDHEHNTVEEFDKEYENLKTFFAYKDISNIYKFYESYKYHRCEKKYDNLFKFDISKCFDSIYTHSISWALLNKDIVKDRLEDSNRTFGGQFDQFMQNVNYGETNGIIIGPEFSRIFAEIILQQIDFEVFKLLKEQNPSLIYKRDYEIFRYVDDFFVFYNDEATKAEIIKLYRLIFRDYKLYISDKKSYQLTKPLITGITRAKLRITDLLNDNLSFLVTDQIDGDELEKQYSFYVSSNKLITRFKTIIKETEIEYQEILNYTFACVDRKVFKLIKIFSKITDKQEHERKVTKAILEILDFTFFLYTVSPKVNTTIKLCMILSKITKLVKVKGNFNQDNKHLIFKKIYDDIFLVLKKYKSSTHTQVETLYLLIALKELGREYRLDEYLLGDHYGINITEERCNNYLNYFSIVVLLFYIEDKIRYKKTKAIIKNHIINLYQDVSNENRLKNTELSLMFFDLISCPFLDNEFKNKLFSFYGYDDSMNEIKNDIINYRQYWFTKWTNFDFGKELEAKKSQEVY